MKKQNGRFLFIRHAEFICSALPHPALRLGLSLRTSSCGPASLKGPETSSGRRTCFGRSMIEMLGVLAIVGVLSIGGIALYRRAVNHHHANTILDDANRFAFVITERGGFPTNAFIDNVQYEQTSVYNLDAFVGAAGGQFGIVVTDVPKGVCEPLIDKAHIDYKVRVLPANTAESIEQLSASGLIYDSFNKDICTNDLNDIVLYFGDTSAQCNKPKEGEDYTPCLSNAECCGGSFCYFSNSPDCYTPGIGRCEKLTETNFPAEIKTTSDGHTWLRSKRTMNWWSAKNWCLAQGRQMANRSDIGCGHVFHNRFCTIQTGQGSATESGLAYEGSILRKLQDAGLTNLAYHWLDDAYDSCYAYLLNPGNSYFVGSNRYHTVSVLCK